MLSNSVRSWTSSGGVAASANEPERTTLTASPPVDAIARRSSGRIAASSVSSREASVASETVITRSAGGAWRNACCSPLVATASP